MLTWIVLRAAGIGAYLMLWATVSWGLIGTASLSGKKVARATAINVHQFLATTAFVLLGVHIGGLLLDSFVPFKPVDVLVPLHTTYQTLPVAFGIVSMYLLAIVLFSSWLRKHMSTKVWRTLHLLAIPTFALALVHGVFAGTDTVRPWMWWGYVATGGSVLFFTLARALTIGLRPTRAPAPPHARARAAAAAAAAAEPALAQAPRRRVVPAARRSDLSAVGAAAAGAPSAAEVAPATDVGAPVVGGTRQRVTPASRTSGTGPRATPAASGDGPALPPGTTPVRDARPLAPAISVHAVPDSAASGPRPAESEDPATVIIRLELAIEGEQAHGRRRIDLPVRLHAATHARDHRAPHTEHIAAVARPEPNPAHENPPDPGSRSD